MHILGWPEAIVLCTAILALAWRLRGAETPVTVIIQTEGKVTIPPDDDERFG